MYFSNLYSGICRVGSAVGFDFCTLETASIDDSQVTDNSKEYLADLITIYGYDHTSQDWPLSIPSFSVPTATKTSSSQVSKLSSQESNLTFVRFVMVFVFQKSIAVATETTNSKVQKLASNAQCNQSIRLIFFPVIRILYFFFFRKLFHDSQ